MRTPKYTDAIRELENRLVQTAASDFRLHLEMNKGSPIEQVFLAAIMAANWCSRYQLGPDRDLDCAVHLTKAGLLDVSQREPARFAMAWPEPVIVCAIQGRIQLADRLIRPDFAFVWMADEHVTKVIVELDGHDFHERTPEQAQSDKSRDRELQRLGWRVLRFTGREVLRSPAGCLDEVVQLVESASRAADEAKWAHSEEGVTE